MDPTEENPQEKWLILDNCAIHDKEQTVNLGKECGMQILFLPPYSPQLNPI
jgi:transposase